MKREGSFNCHYPDIGEWTEGVAYIVPFKHIKIIIYLFEPYDMS